MPEGDGVGGSEIIMTFPERYYEKNDIISNDKTRQQYFVVARPTMVAGTGNWHYICRLMDNDLNHALDKSGCNVGDTTHFLSNAHPLDYHEEGKYILLPSSAIIYIIV